MRRCSTATAAKVYTLALMCLNTRQTVTGTEKCADLSLASLVTTALYML